MKKYYAFGKELKVGDKFTISNTNNEYWPQSRLNDIFTIIQLGYKDKESNYTYHVLLSNGGDLKTPQYIVNTALNIYFKPYIKDKLELILQL